MVEPAAVSEFVLPAVLPDSQKLYNDNLRLAETLANRVWRRISRRSNHGLEREDLLQEARLGLLRAARTYDTEKGTQFSTWAYSNIRYSLSAALREIGEAPELAGLGDDEQPAAGLVVPPFVDRADDRLDLASALNSLTPEDRELLEDVHIRYLTHGQIAEKNGCCTKTIQRRVASITAALRSSLVQ